MYTAEIVRPRFRATISLVLCIFELLGNLFVYFLGYSIESLTISLYMAILAFILLLCVSTIPESPYWYILKKDKEKAIKSLIQLRHGEDTAIRAELEEIEGTLEETEDSTSFVNTICRIKWWKKFALLSIYVALFELLGFDVIIPYSEQFFATINRTKLDNRTVAVIFACTALIGVIAWGFVVDNVRRKPLMQSTNFFNFVILAIAGAVEIFWHIDGSSVITLCCFFIYGATVSITCFSLNWTVINEVLPSEFRSTSMAALTAVFSILYFTFLKLFPLLLSRVPVGYIIWLFGVVSLLNCFYIGLFIKETKGTILSGNRNT